jgi:hypothetical protein
MISILTWLRFNPTLAILILLGVAIAGYKVQVWYYSSKAESYKARAITAEDTVKQIEKRDKAVEKVKLKHKEEENEIEALISSRRYFDAN